LCYKLLENMKIKKILVIVFLIFLLPVQVMKAQTFDFEMWLGVPQWAGGYEYPQKFHFSAGSQTVPASYIIDMPGNSAFVPISGTVAAGGSQIVDMTNFVDAIKVTPANTVVNRALRVRVKGQMGAYYAIEDYRNFATIPLRGPNALGTSFIIPSQNSFDNRPGAFSQFIVTATQDNTEVTINPSAEIVGHGATVPFTIILNRGQSYSARSIASSGNHLGGSLVSSNLPIAITYTDDLVTLIGPQADNLGDQLVPITRLGLMYVYVRTPLVYDGVYGYATENNTTVKVFDGVITDVYVINKGERFGYALRGGRGAASIIADKPIMAFQIGGWSNEIGGTMLTPVSNCKGIRSLAYQYLGQLSLFTFIAPDAILDDFIVNGDPDLVKATDFVAIPGITGWKYFSKRMETLLTFGQVVDVRNTSGNFYFYQNMSTGAGGDFSNFSDFGNVVSFPKATRICGSNDIKLNNNTQVYNTTIASLSWIGPNGYTSTEANPVITNFGIGNSGTYQLVVTDENGCSYTENLEIGVPIDHIALTPSPSEACSGSAVQFTSEKFPASSVVKNIKWTGPNGFTSSQANFEITNMTAAQAGTYTCTYIDEFNCEISSATTITINSATVSTFSIASSNSKISCSNPSVTLTVTGFSQGIDYKVYTPYNASSIYASSDFTKIVTGFYNEEPTAIGVGTEFGTTNLTGITPTSIGYGVDYEGYINISTAGNYTFYTNSVDGSNLYIDGSLLIDNDGVHGIVEKGSVATFLSVGYHSIKVNYFKSSVGSAAVLSASYSGPSIVKQIIPATVLFHSEGTAPGLTYNWSNGIVNSNSITVTNPGEYTVTGTAGNCSSTTKYTVKAISSYDYSDSSAPWPIAQAKVLSCVVSGKPSGSNGAVWAGSGISTDIQPLLNSEASADTFDDGLLAPTGSAKIFNVLLSSNTPGTRVYYGVWIDWNNNGNFADDAAFYSGNELAGISVPISIVQPAGAAVKYKTRLIVADVPLVFSSFDDIFENGEIEDYTLIQSISGNVFRDANGLKGTPSNTVNGIGTNAGGLIVSLVNSSGNVVANAPVATNGTYSFNSIFTDTYSIVLSTDLGTIGSAPQIANLPAGWVNIGENVGLVSGTDGNIDGVLTGIVVNTTNVVNANFGIDNRPIADSKTACVRNPGGTTNINVPVLTGTDSEDGIYNGISNTNTIIIKTLPANGILYYNATLASIGQLIVNYNPTLLNVDPQDGSFDIIFNYSEVDAAGIESIPASVNMTVRNIDAGVDFSKSCIDNVSGKTIGSAGVPGVAYTWLPATGLSSATAANPVANPAVTTTYTVTATDTATGCSATDTVVVTVDVATLSADAGVDFSKSCIDNVSGKTIGSAGVPGVAYAWLPATGLSSATAANPVANPAVTTTYTVTATDTATGCSATDTVVVTVDVATLSADAGVDFSKSCIDNVSGKTIGSTGVPGVAYAWLPATGLSSATAANPVANPAVTTTYTVTATDTATGCSATDTVVVTVDVATPTADAGVDFSKSCIDNVSGKTIGSTGVPGVAYAWLPATGLSSATAANPVANPAVTTTYTVTATDTATGCSATDTVVVTVDVATLSADAGVDFSKSCIDNVSGKTIGSAGVPGVAYAWLPATGLSSTTAANPVANPAVTTTYTVTATDTATGCSATDTVVVTVDIATPTADAGVDFSKSCIDNVSGKTIGSAGVPGVAYAWLPATGLSSTTAANPVANPAVTTTYTVTATDTATGCSATDTVVVTVDIATPTADAGVDFSKSCIDNVSGKTIGSAGVPGVAYTWLPATGLSSATAANPVANPAVTTTYTVTATDTATGCSATDTVVVTVDVATLSADAGVDFSKSCIDNVSGKTIGSTGVPGVAYAWLPATGLSSATAANPVANPAVTTTYTVTATDTATGCSATDTVVVTVDVATLSADAGVDFSKSCIDNVSGKTIGSTGVPGVAYAWLPATGLSSATAANPVANPAVTTTYTVTATDTATGCSATDTVVVTVDVATPTADAGVDFSKSCIDNVSGKTIGSTGVPGVAYAWLPATGLSSATAANPVANPAVTTTYTVTATDTATGCSATDTVVVTVDIATPTADAGVDFSKSCIDNVSGKTIGSTGVPGVAYAWLPATGLSSATAANPVANPAVTTTYTVTATDTATGCSATDTVVVTVDIATLSAGTNKTTYKFGTVKMDASGNGTWTEASGNPATTVITSPINPSTAITGFTAEGTYNFVWTLPNGCNSIVSVIIGATSIIANDDNGITINGLKGGTSFINVLSNDVINDNPASQSNVNLTFLSSSHSGITLSGTNVIVASGTPSGNHFLVYRICDKLDPTDCTTATVHIFIVTPSIAVIKTATFNDENGDKSAQVGETITYNFTVTNSGDMALSNIIIKDPLPNIVLAGGPISLEPLGQDSTTFVGKYVITQTDIINGSISNQATVYGVDTNGFVVEDKSDDQNNLEDKPTVLWLSGCAVKVFNAVSPNDDGINDLFYIEGLECYTNNNIQIFNRWGVLVFERDNYNNRDRAFRGISEGHVTVSKGEKLPDGTYFYVINVQDNDGKGFKKAGYLYVNN
jgi:gliding motility-associated-like protein